MPLDFAWLGQGPALDLANTFVPAQQADLLGQWSESRQKELSLTELRDLRATVTSVLEALAQGAQPPEEAIEKLNVISAEAPLHTTLRDGRLEVHEPFAGAVARAVFALAAGHETVATCRAPGCGMFFVRAHPRQVWCCHGCGNRARVARHYARAKAEKERVDAVERPNGPITEGGR
ncbi:CGNR zinc finger domain-containing protein [Gaiella occulta]|nr:CGNR zinc finger domain-containing protein [Gaiella occulta]